MKTAVKAITILAASFLVLSGCNTIQGAGKDISAGGQALAKAAGADHHSVKTTQTKTVKQTTTTSQDTSTPTPAVRDNASVTSGQ